jgi:hypothetical protein
MTGGGDCYNSLKILMVSTSGFVTPKDENDQLTPLTSIQNKVFSDKFIKMDQKKLPPS